MLKTIPSKSVQQKLKKSRPEYDAQNKGDIHLLWLLFCAESILILKDTYRLLCGEGDLSGTKLEEKNKEMNKNIVTVHT